MKIRILALGLLLATTSAIAADIDGKWVGPIDSPQGAMMVSYSFKSEGHTFTGTTASPDGSALATFMDMPMDFALKKS